MHRRRQRALAWSRKRSDRRPAVSVSELATRLPAPRCKCVINAEHLTRSRAERRIRFWRKEPRRRRGKCLLVVGVAVRRVGVHGGGIRVGGSSRWGSFAGALLIRVIAGDWVGVTRRRGRPVPGSRHGCTRRCAFGLELGFQGPGGARRCARRAARSAARSGPPALRQAPGDAEQAGDLARLVRQPLARAGARGEERPSSEHGDPANRRSGEHLTSG